MQTNRSRSAWQVKSMERRKRASFWTTQMQRSWDNVKGRSSTSGVSFATDASESKVERGHSAVRLKRIRSLKCYQRNRTTWFTLQSVGRLCLSLLMCTLNSVATPNLSNNHPLETFDKISFQKYLFSPWTWLVWVWPVPPAACRRSLCCSEFSLSRFAPLKLSVWLSINSTAAMKGELINILTIAIKGKDFKCRFYNHLLCISARYKSSL